MSRFAECSNEDIDNLLKAKDAAQTKKATEQSWRVFEFYLKEKSVDLNIETITKLELDDILKKFYVEARKANGDYYRKTSLNCLRHGLNRRIKEIHADWDIINDQEFQGSGLVYSAQCTSLKRMGLAKVEHYPPISREDLHKLYNCNVFNMNQPKTLQWKVVFELMLYLCRRGQENLRQLTKASFVIKTGDNGSRYIEKVVDELTKNHRVNDENEDSGVIVETKDELCPIMSFEKYISKLNPKVDCLFQRPKKVAPADGPWYDAQAIGINTLEKFMKNISEDAKLSQIYTNHSIRATTITMLDGEGYEARHILTVSGHRSANSLRSYCRTNLATKRKISECLSSCSRNVTESSQPTTLESEGSAQNVGTTIENIAKKSNSGSSSFRSRIIGPANPLLSSRNFDFGITFPYDDENTSPESSENATVENEGAFTERIGDSIDFSVNHPPHGLPLIIRNNSNCVFNIKL